MAVLHICGLYCNYSDLVPVHDPQTRGSRFGHPSLLRHYLPQLSLSAHASIVSTTSRITLTQTFANPTDAAIRELRYTFPLYDGVSVVGFVCTILDSGRELRGVVKARDQARRTYQAAVERGQTAGLVEQSLRAADVFTTTVGNVPARAHIRIEITYLGELAHDAQVDGIRFTIPTGIAPRYGQYPGELAGNIVPAGGPGAGMSITVDAEMPEGCRIRTVESPSHAISVTMGNTSVEASGAEPSLQKASATLSSGTAELERDFVLRVVADGASSPVAVLETHPALPNHRALMATLVPKFRLPASGSRPPEIVFVCDRSGSMGGFGSKMPNLRAALHLMLRSLPLGARFNICSFGGGYEFLFPDGSAGYDAASLERAARYVDGMEANFSGTEMYAPLEAAFAKRYPDMDLEIFLVTDGEVMDQDRLIRMVGRHVEDSEGAVRVFALGLGIHVSHSLLEGVARAGNGLAQAVGNDEPMNAKVVRMLRAALSPHVKDYTLEVKYDGATTTGEDADPNDDDDTFEMVEKEVQGSTNIDTPALPRKFISLFDPSANLDEDIAKPNELEHVDKFAALPPLAPPPLLQAPFRIPFLHPFSRTSVYLLLSPATIRRGRPTSVVLRGTTTASSTPLELEMPVTALPAPAETIHQLAARKAMRELEDGRGWIFHRRVAADGEQLLLSDKYPGRFADMVEREAVRLGTAFGVGGRWCSFVAVEDGQEAQEDGQEAQEAQEEEGDGPDGRSVGSRQSDLADESGESDDDDVAGFALFDDYIWQPKTLPTSAAAANGPPGPGLVGAAPASTPDEETPTSTKSVLDRLVLLQTFGGSWAWSDELAAVLGGDVAAKAEGLGQQLTDELATALVLAFLGKKLGEKKEEWELLAEKARAWLAQKVVGGMEGAEEAVARMGGLLVLTGGLAG